MSGPAARCRVCGDVIWSESLHDFQSCGCGAISIDGGEAYTRTVGDPLNFDWNVQADELAARRKRKDVVFVLKRLKDGSLATYWEA